MMATVQALDLFDHFIHIGVTDDLTRAGIKPQFSHLPNHDPRIRQQDRNIPPPLIGGGTSGLSKNTISDVPNQLQVCLTQGVGFAQNLGRYFSFLPHHSRHSMEYYVSPSRASTADPRSALYASHDQILPSTDWRIRPEWCD
jgi:hypothetical protein